MPTKKKPVPVNDNPPKFEEFLTDLKQLGKKPKETPLEAFVRENLDVFLAAIEQGYTHGDICQLAQKRDIPGASPTALGKALSRYTPEDKKKNKNNKPNQKELDENEES